MEGKTHKIIAPIFTLGVTTAYLTTNSADLPLTLAGTVGIATVSSFLSACWPDADQHAKYKPLPVIWAGFTPVTDVMLKSYGLKKIKTKANAERGIKSKTAYLYKGRKYTKVRSLGARIWASFFRITGLREHRDWRSHSPLLWIPLWYYLYSLTNSIPYLGIFLGPIFMGFGLGYISHILGDAFTKSGIPFLPSFGIVEKVPIVNHFTEVKVFKGKFFKADNKLWNYIVIIIIADISLYLISPEFGTKFNQTIWNSLVAIFETGVAIVQAMISK